MKSLYKVLAVMALNLKALASSASAAITIAHEMYPRQFQSSCSTSFIVSTSTYLVYQPEVFSNPPEVGGPAWSTRTTGTGLYATRTGTETHTVSFCEQKTTQALPTTSQEPITDTSTSAAPTTVTSTIPPVTVTLRVPDRKEIETGTQPSSTSSEAVPEPDQTTTESISQSIINTCAVTSAPSAPVLTAFNPDSDLTWGCPPGTNCDPPKPQLCEAWTDSPADEFTCQAAHCQPIKALILGGGNEDGKFPLNEGYFDLDPSQFGLGFDIFVKPGFSTTDARSLARGQYNDTSSSEDNDKSRPKQARELSSQLIPAACFETCNNAYLEAQSTGKGPRLCRPESAFVAYYLGCDSCVDHNAEQMTGALGFITGSSYLSGKFSQFLRYCRMRGDINLDGLWPAGTPSSSSAAGHAPMASDGDKSPPPGASSNAGAVSTVQKLPPPPSSGLPAPTAEAGPHMGQGLRPTSSSFVSSTAERRASQAGAEAASTRHVVEATSSATTSSASAETTSSNAATEGSNPSPAPNPLQAPKHPPQQPPPPPASAHPAADMIVSPGSPSPASTASPVQSDQTNDGAATNHNVHSSTAANVSVAGRPTGPVVLVASSPTQRTNFLGKFGAWAFAIIASAFLV